MVNWPRVAAALTLTALAALPLTSPATATAQPARAPAPKPQSSADERAFTLYEQGRAAFREGRYSEAVVLLLESQRLKPEPVLDFNIAKAYEALGEHEKAITHYETFLANAKDLPDRAEIEAKVKELRGLVAAKTATPKDPNPPPTPPPPAETSGPAPSPLPWIVAGVGLVGIGVGAGLGAAASSTNDDVAGAPSQVDGAATRASAEDLALGANLALGIGGAVLAGGVIWGIIDLTSGEGEASDGEPAVTALVGPGAASLRIVFR